MVRVLAWASSSFCAGSSRGGCSRLVTESAGSRTSDGLLVRLYTCPTRPCSSAGAGTGRACKKCAQTPILLIPLSPHYLYHPQSAPLTSSWRLQKVCTNPYFIDSTFLSLFIPYWLDTTPSRWPLGNGTRPRLDPHKARPHRFSRRGRWPRARARRTWALGLGLRAVGVSARARADPCGAGASRVGVERLEPTPSRIILHLRRLSVAVLAEGAVSTACPRHTAGPARPHRLRSVRHAMRQPGAVGRCGATQGCTQAVSACSTPATCLAKSRQSARLCAAAQGTLHLIACNRLGTRRVGRAVRCSVVRRCWAIACGGGPLPKARTSCTGCACAWSCAPTHGKVARACW